MCFYIKYFYILLLYFLQNSNLLAYIMVGFGLLTCFVTILGLLGIKQKNKEYIRLVQYFHLFIFVLHFIFEN